MPSLPTRVVAGLCLLALLATACGTRDADLAFRANPRNQGSGGEVGFGTSPGGTVEGVGEASDDGFGDGTATVARPSSASTGTGGQSGPAPASAGPGSGPAGQAPSQPSGASGSGGTEPPAPGSAALPGGPEGQPVVGATTAPAGGCTAAADSFKVGYLRTDAGGVGGLTGSDVSAVNVEAQEREWQALFQWARDTGGLCGAEIEPIGETISAVSREEERLAICVRFTEDHQVDFMVDTTLMTLFPSVVQCFHDHGVPIIGGVTTLDRDFIAGDVAGTIGHPGAALDRLMVAAALGPDQVGFYDEGTLGVILREDPVFQRAYDRHMAPAFASVGADIAAFSLIAKDGSTAPNVLLQMRTAGVDHIVFVGGILEWLAFANAAEAQGYRPRYAVGEYVELAGVTAFYGPHAQLRDAVASAVSATGVVYVPPGEEPQRIDPSDPNGTYQVDRLPPGARQCLDILSEYTGTDYYTFADNSTQESFICDNAMLFVAAARAVPGQLSGATLGQGINALSSHAAFRFNAVGFGPGVYDGANDYRVGVFHDSAQLYVAVTDWQGLPR